MCPQHLFHRAFSFGACGAALVLCAEAAEAKGERACLPAYDAYKSALEREESGHLREARALLQTCEASAPPACGGLVQKCTAKYKQLGSVMSTVVPLVTDDAGAPRVDVQVKIDGDVLTSQLDGKGLPVDIGLHEFAFSSDGGVFATQRVLVLEGQRNRVLSVVLHGTLDQAAPDPGLSSRATPAAVVEARHTAKSPAAEPASEKQPPDRPTSNDSALERPAGADAAGDKGDKGDKAPANEAPLPERALKETPRSPTAHRSAVPAYLLGGAGLVGLGAGTLLTLWGRNDNDLLAQCKPNCKPSSVDHVRTLYIASDVSFGVGVVALGTATWLFLHSRSTDSARAPAAAISHFDVKPSPSGAVASIQWAF